MKDKKIPEKIAGESKMSPMAVASMVLETRDYELLECDEHSEHHMCFAMPNHFKECSEAAINYKPHLNLYEVITCLIEGKVRPPIKEEFYRLLAELMVRTPGIQLTYTEGEEEDGSDSLVEVAIAIFLTDDKPRSQQLDSVLTYYEEVVVVVFPPILDFVLQEYKYRISTDGQYRGIKLVRTVEQCLEMASHGKAGRA